MLQAGRDDERERWRDKPAATEGKERHGSKDPALPKTGKLREAGRHYTERPSCFWADDCPEGLAGGRTVSEVAIKELYDHVERVLGFGDVHVIEEAVKQTFPHVEFGFHARFHQLLVCVEG